jgi:hypothetical protein
MKEKDEKPFEFFSLLKEMMNEETSIKEIYKDLDIEPKPFKRWFSRHKELITVFIVPLVISIIAAVISYLIGFFSIQG